MKRSAWKQSGKEAFVSGAEKKRLEAEREEKRLKAEREEKR